jgi:hypothetical protein
MPVMVTRSQARMLVHASLAVCVVCLVVLLAGATNADAAGTLEIEQFPNPWLATHTPQIEGTTPHAVKNLDTETFTPVVVKVYEGPKAEGIAQTFESAPFTGHEWSVPVTLPDGLYTAKASQGGEESNEITFTIDTEVPAVSITAPAAGSESVGEMQFLAGSAGSDADDSPELIVRLFSGSSVGAQALQEIPVKRSGAGWSVFAALQPGTYTAVAVQTDAAGSTGESKPATFTVLPPQSKPAAPPVASFSWLPAAPIAGQAVALVSSSTDPGSALTSFSWDLAGNGPFSVSGPVVTTSFATAGAHFVRLRVLDALGLESVASAAIQVSPAPLKLMQPFPIVRIGGVVTATGARLSSLSVLAPVGARVRVTCSGPGCRLKPQSAQARSTSRNRRGNSIVLYFPRFARSFGAGATLEVRVSASGEIGKYTRFVIRRHNLPSRLDECLSGLEPKPVACTA